MPCNRQRRRGRRGTYAVEFALVFPVLVLFMFAVFEYGRFLMARQVLDNAAREGARVAACNPGFKQDPNSGAFTVQTLTTADIQNTVINYLAGQDFQNASGQKLSASDVQVYRADPLTGQPMTDQKGSDWTKASFGDGIAVKITCQYRPMLPSFGYLTSPEPVSFICVMRSEAND
jgi:Flp pilus assembly protein TadG